LIKGKEGKMADTFLTRLTGNMKKVAILVYAKLNGSTFIELK